MALRFDVFIGIIAILFIIDRIYDGYYVNLIFSATKYLQIVAIILIAICIITAYRTNPMYVMNFIHSGLTVLS
jgi:hypothetical protein